MTKNNIYLLDGYTSYYTLGALSDDSDDVLTISQNLYDGGTFDIKNLVSKAFDVKSFETSVVFDIKNTRDLKKFNRTSQPYSLKVGSNVRYKNKSYDVIGFYYNQFAQLNIVSPILFNPSSLVSDVSNLFYGLKTNEEVKQIINDNLKAGKYSADILFPLTVGVKNYKKELSNIQPPPFTSLDSISIKRKEEVKVGEPLIPYVFDINQFSKIRLESILEELEQKGEITKSDIDFYLDLQTFRDLVEKRTPSDSDYTKFYYEFYKSNNMIRNGELPLLPYNLISKAQLQFLNDNYVYNTPIGNLYPIMRVGNSIPSLDYKNKYRFGIYNSVNRKTYQSDLINDLLFTQYAKEGYAKDVSNDSKDFIDKHETKLKRSSSFFSERYAYSLKENTFYGGFYATSGTPEFNSINDEKVLPFGTIFKSRGLYYYVLSYLNTYIGSNQYCLCIKASTRKKVITLGLDAHSLTELKANYKKFTKEEVYSAFKKEGHIFDIDDSYYSLPQSADAIKKQKEQTPNATLVTDVFLNKRAEQFEVLQSNFPQLSDTFLGILSVLDKSLTKPKIADLIQEKGLVYVQLSDSNTISNINSDKHDSEENQRFSRLLKEVGERNLDETLQLLKTAKGSENISDKILNLATDTYKIQIQDESSLYIALKSYEGFQKYALSRIAINLYDNYEIFVLNEKATWNFKKLTFGTLNSYSSLSLNCFLGTLDDMYVSGIYQQGSDPTYSFYKKESGYRNQFQLKVFDETSTYTKYAFAYSQFIFVYGVLNVLYKNANRMIMATNNGLFNNFIENENFIREIRQYDLSISFDFIKNNVEEISFLEVNQDVIAFEKLELNEKRLVQIFNTKPKFDFDRNFKDDIENFKILILQLDKVYGGIFDLENRIIKNKSKEILNNFPKVEEIEEGVFDDTDLFEDAFEELGDEFLENIEELDIDELI